MNPSTETDRTWLGRCELLRRISRGDTAELYSARRSGANGFEKLLAIKRVRPDLQHDSHVVDRFLSEARVAALMNHPNIIQVYDLDTAGDGTFMLMEHLHGHDLGALASELYFRRQRMSLPQVL